MKKVKLILAILLALSLTGCVANYNKTTHDSGVAVKPIDKSI